MATNYYVNKDTDDEKHIGKYSNGWWFLFSTDLGSNKAAVMNNLRSNYRDSIKNEYDEPISYDKMYNIIHHTARMGYINWGDYASECDGMFRDENSLFYFCDGEFC